MVDFQITTSCRKIAALYLNKKYKTSIDLPDRASGLLVLCAFNGQTPTTFVTVVPLNKSMPAAEISFSRSIAAANAAGLFWAGGRRGTVNGWWKFGGCTWRPTRSGAGLPVSTRSKSCSLSLLPLSVEIHFHQTSQFWTWWTLRCKCKSWSINSNNSNPFHSWTKNWIYSYSPSNLTKYFKKEKV